MTVRELIEKLEYFPKELEVVDCRDDVINNVKQVEYYFNGVKNEYILWKNLWKYLWKAQRWDLHCLRI